LASYHDRRRPSGPRTAPGPDKPNFLPRAPPALRMAKLPVFFEVGLRAPLAFCYAWLTDFEPSDKDLNPGLARRQVIERTHDQVRMVDEAVGTPINKREVTVTLHPPDAWDAEAEGTIYDYDLHYRLAPETRGTRLSISGVVTTKPSCPFNTREENHARFVNAWGHYKAALEAEHGAISGGSGR
jgi:uncharacterized protein with LGFP repeats